MKLPQIIDEAYMESIEKSGLLREIPLARHLPAMKTVEFQVKTYGPEEIIFFEGEEVRSIAVLHSGTVRGEKFHLEGNVDLMYMYQRGEIFGAEATVSRQKTSPLTYIANEEVSVISINFISIMRSEYAMGLMLALLHILADNSIKKLYKIDVLSKRGLRERIMTHLRIMAAKAASDRFCIHMDREQFAQYLCVNRSALSYELNEMKRDGLIDFKKDTFRLLEKK